MILVITAQTTESVSDPCDGVIAELADPRRDRNYQLQPGETEIDDWVGITEWGLFVYVD